MNLNIPGLAFDPVDPLGIMKNVPSIIYPTGPGTKGILAPRLPQAPKPYVPTPSDGKWPIPSNMDPYKMIADIMGYK